MRLLPIFISLITISLSAADVVRVRATRVTTGNGWGVAVARDLVLTTAHVLKDDAGYRAAEIEVGGEWLKAELVKRDEKHDLALLRIKANLKPAEIFKAGKLTLVGSPRAEVALNRKASPYEIRIKVEFGHDASGMSGSPVFDEKSRLVGLFVSQEAYVDESAMQVKPKGGGGTMVAADVIAEFLKNGE